MGGSSFSQTDGEGLKLDKRTFQCTVGSEKPASGKFLIFKGFFLQFKACWALFVPQRVTSS